MVLCRELEDRAPVGVLDVERLHLAAIVRGQFPGRAQGQEQDHVHIGVKSIHLMAAENDPAALFTVVTFHPPHGPAEYVLGHRVA